MALTSAKTRRELNGPYPCRAAFVPMTALSAARAPVPGFHAHGPIRPPGVVVPPGAGAPAVHVPGPVAFARRPCAPLLGAALVNILVPDCINFKLNFVR